MTKWLTYCEAEDRTDLEPPGPVNNEHIMRELCRLQRGEEKRDNAQYYSVSKHLFYFFVALYGGGPVVVPNDQWKAVELSDFNA